MGNEHILKDFWDILKLFHIKQERSWTVKWTRTVFVAITVGGNIVNICKYFLCALSVDASYMPAVIRFSGSTSTPFICEISSWNNPLILTASPIRRLATCSYKRSAHFQYLHIFGAVTGAVICGLSPWSEMAG